MQVFDRSDPFGAATIAAVATGGAIGATGRWLVAWSVDWSAGDHQPGTWPWATLLVNVVGCLLIGVAARRTERDTKGWAFAVTGVLGGFTTFSALAVELNDMADAERLPLAALYTAVTLLAGVAATAVADRTRR